MDVGDQPDRPALCKRALQFPGNIRREWWLLLQALLHEPCQAGFQLLCCHGSLNSRTTFGCFQNKNLLELALYGWLVTQLSLLISRLHPACSLHCNHRDKSLDVRSVTSQYNRDCNVLQSYMTPVSSTGILEPPPHATHTHTPPPKNISRKLLPATRFEVRCVCERGHGEKCEKKEPRQTQSLQKPETPISP